MSFEFYKSLHLLGFILTFAGLSGLLMVKINASIPSPSILRWSSITHGVGLLLILVSGFGMAARLGLVAGLPVWVYLKIGIWILVGGSLTLVKRRASLGWPLYFSILGLGFLGAWVAVNKPF